MRTKSDANYILSLQTKNKTNLVQSNVEYQNKKATNLKKMSN